MSCCNVFLYFTLAFAIRIGLVYVATIVDEISTTNRYTDTDYDVFSDAATHVRNGGSPYARSTYRYTPLVAYMVLVNNFIHPLAAKVLFCVLDILMGAVFWRICSS